MLYISYELTKTRILNFGAIGIGFMSSRKALKGGGGIYLLYDPQIE